MDLPDYLAGGEVARLIPVAADSKREARATSILMATISMVPAFSAAMLATIGQRAGARAKLDCFTEVVLKDDGGEPKCRPDGLMLLDSGRGRSWSCLIEAKIGNADLEGDQVERYLALAKRNGIDAVLTLSNQFAAVPTHSPAKVSKAALKGCDLFHWSWTFLLTQALLILEEDRFDHPSQKYILAEMVRYFSHPSTGVSTFDRMNPEWKDLVSRVQAGATLSKAESGVESSVAAWHQEMRDLSLLLSRKLYRHVRTKLPRAHIDDPMQRLKDDCEKLAREHKLEGVFEIPDAAAPLVVIADLLRRSVYVSMTLAAPSDKQRASSRISWVVRQLAKSSPEGLHIKATWPGRAPATQAELAAVLRNPEILESDNKSLVPGSFEIVLVRDLAGKFSGARTFIEQLEDAVPLFYEQVGQHIRAYVAPPPRIVQKKTADAADEVPSSEIAVIASEAEDAAAAAAGSVEIGADAAENDSINPKIEGDPIGS